MRIKSIHPRIALPGGVVRLEMEGLGDPFDCRVRVGGAEAERMALSRSFVTIRVPDGAGPGVTVAAGGDEAAAELKVGRLLASELHMVTSPAVDSRGTVYATFSGTKGEKVPFGVFVIGEGGQREPFLAEITNPTALAVGPDDWLYVSSRHDGAIYRSSPDKRVEKVVDGLGLATGIAFDDEGNLFVGDRAGSIHKITPERGRELLCELEPSVSAYHLAVGPDRALYVTGPTFATRDCVYRVAPDGAVEEFFRGFGRPQGIAFDADSNLQVAASWRGRKGVFSFRGSEPEWTVSGPMLVGLAYSPDRRRLYLADNAQLFAVEL